MDPQDTPNTPGGTTDYSPYTFWARYPPWYHTNPPEPADAIAVIRQPTSPQATEQVTEQLTSDGLWHPTGLLHDQRMGNPSSQPRLEPLEAATAERVVADLRSRSRLDRDQQQATWVGTGAESHLYLTHHEDQVVQRLHERANAHADRFDTLLGEAADHSGGHLVHDGPTGITHTVKDLDTLRRRFADSLSVGLRLSVVVLAILDYNRYTIVFDNLDTYTLQVRQAGDLLTDRGWVLSHVRNRWNDTAFKGLITWWHDHTLAHPMLDHNDTTDNAPRYPVEVQFHTPQSHRMRIEDCILHRGLLARALRRHEYLLHTRAETPMTLWRDGPDGLQYLSLIDWTWHPAGTEADWATPRKGEWRWVDHDQAQQLARDRQHWVTYYACYPHEGDQPFGVLRERNVPDLLVERYTDPQGWQPTTMLYNVNGHETNARPRFQHVSHTEADRILHTRHGEPGLARLEGA